MNRDEEWKLDGLCNEIGGELWYPESDSKAARQVCARCPVRQQCLDCEWCPDCPCHDDGATWPPDNEKED